MIGSSTGNEQQPSPQAPSKPKTFKRPRKKSERSFWIAGDVLEFVHQDEFRQVMVRQKGADRSNLVLTSPQSCKLLLQPDGSDVPLPNFNTNILITSGPSDLPMHPDCFVHEHPLPPLIPMEEIATGRYDEHFKRLWEKFPDEDVPPAATYDDDFIDTYEEYDPPDRLKNLLLDLQRREHFRAQCNFLPMGEYDFRLAELIEEARALVEEEKQSAYKEASSPPPNHTEEAGLQSASSTSQSGGSDSSSEDSDDEGCPDEPDNNSESGSCISKSGRALPRSQTPPRLSGAALPSSNPEGSGHDVPGLEEQELQTEKSKVNGTKPRAEGPVDTPTQANHEVPSIKSQGVPSHPPVGHQPALHHFESASPAVLPRVIEHGYASAVNVNTAIPPTFAPADRPDDMDDEPIPGTVPEDPSSNTAKQALAAEEDAVAREEEDVNILVTRRRGK